MHYSWKSKSWVQPALNALLVILFFELVSLFNTQWGNPERIMPYPFDFLLDIKNGLLVPTLVDVVSTSVLYVLGYCWYCGGLSRIIVQFIVWGIASIAFALIGTAFLFNSWMHIHIITLKQFIEVAVSLTPHTKAYTRFCFSFVLASAIPLFFYFKPTLRAYSPRQ